MFEKHRRRVAASVLGPQSRRHRRILTLDSLEERIVLSPTPTVYTVYLTTDNGATSAGFGSGTMGDLRYCINQADADPNPDGTDIEFAPSVFGTAQTIFLSSKLGTLDLADTATTTNGSPTTHGPMTIEGPDAGVTVSGGHKVGVFQVSAGVTASLSGLTITGGSATGSGGGLLNQGATTLTDCTLSGNSAAPVGNGGGLYSSGSITLTDCTLSGNSAGVLGGGLLTFGTATITDCTISGNSAGFGGGLYNFGTATITDCTVSGNSAGFGGGLYTRGSQPAALTDTIVAGNTGQNVPAISPRRLAGKSAARTT